MNANNIILTGPPRSGTTLACHLLNKVDNTVALHEPMNLKMFPDPERGLANIDSFYADMRASLLRDGKALSKVADGVIPDNPFESQSDGKRQSTVQKGEVSFDKPLSDDFKLVIKQNAHFTFLLNRLVKIYPCYAIIRNPLSTVASWNSIQAPVSEGNLTVLKGLDPFLHGWLESIPNGVDRQVFLIHKLFEPLAQLDPSHIIRYEDMIDSGGKVLQVIVPEAATLDEELTNQNQNKAYDMELMEEVTIKLNALLDASYRKYYPREQIRACLDRMGS